MKKFILLLTIFLLSIFISCEKTNDIKCYICKTNVINIDYKTSVTMFFKDQTDTLCNETPEKINLLENLNYMQDERDSVIHIWTTKCDLK
jgi:hypothetical protein